MSSLLRSIFEAAQVGILLCDENGSISFANQHADQLLGCYGHGFSLEDWLAVIHADDRIAVEAMVPTTRRAAPAQSLRYRVEDDTGDIRWVDQKTTPLHSDAGDLVGSVSTLIETTAEVAAAADLRQSRDFVDALLDTVGALVLVLDRDLRVVRFNKACEEVSGWTSEEVLGRRVVELVVPSDQQAAVDQRLLDLVSTGTAQTAENDWVSRDGQRVRVSWHNTVVVDQEGAVVVIISTGIDVTRQRLLESRLAQTDRLESVGRLAAGIAHDFNNTLAVLRLRVECLVAPDDVQRKNVEALLQTIEHSQSTIADLLAFSRHQELAPRAIQVNTEVRRLDGTLQDLVGDRIELAIRLTDDDTTTMLDPARFEQIVLNLAMNARDAMPEGGVLTIDSAAVIVGGLSGHAGLHAQPAPQTAPATLPAGRYVCLSVTDTGVGIPPENLAHVFDPYFTTKPAGRGTGLGLATAYGTITQSGGEITVDSEVGQGTIFTLWLRRHDEPVGADTGASEAARSPIARVLLVEDDAGLREVLADELRKLGYDVVEVGDGATGLRDGRQRLRPVDHRCRAARCRWHPSRRRVRPP